jgi:hypothetical protein
VTHPTPIFVAEIRNPNTMKREEALQLCHFYRGEEDCPTQFIGHYEEKLWFFEYTACEIIERQKYEPSANPLFVFNNLVANLAAKWCPYTYWEILEVYFQYTPTYKEEILRSLS